MKRQYGSQTQPNHCHHFENAKMLDKEPQYNKIIISEMLFNKKHANTDNIRMTSFCKRFGTRAVF